jgi:hypothetical protein
MKKQSVYLPINMVNVGIYLRRALEAGDDGRMPEVQIRKGWGSVGFEALNGKSMSDLADHYIRILGSRFKVERHVEPDTNRPAYSCSWGFGGGVRFGPYYAERSAIEGLEEVYRMPAVLVRRWTQLLLIRNGIIV